MTGRRGQIALSFGLGLLLAAWLLPVRPLAGELLRYRTPDGKLGFAGDPASIPPGSTILEDGDGRGSMSIVTPLPNSNKIPSPAELGATARARCLAKWPDNYERREYCARQRTRHALSYRELLLQYPAGSEGRAIAFECRDESAEGVAVDYARASRCARERHRDFVRRNRREPASLSLEGGPSAAERERQRGIQTRQEQLDRLRDEQDAEEEAAFRGQAVWGPRYERAVRDLERAENRTRSILRSMRRRGCRADSFACGGLTERLAEARREEEEKRRYLRQGLVEECRRAGCKPGWLR